MSTVSNEEFRDHLYNVDLSGRRVGFYPKRPKGKFYQYRTFVSIFLLLILFGMPWIEMNGEPFFLFNIFERKFILFGQVFWPQDFFMFVFASLSGVISVLLFTVVFGRIWCGWACPQTIFLEMVFRKIEYWIEGDSAAQKRLANAPWTTNKIFKAFSKHSLFTGVSFLVANTLLAYIIGKDQLIAHITSPPAEHLITFFSVIAFTIIFYFIFAWFREQACIMVCPYGRLQGVLLDADSLVISYDHKRGEPRGKLKKGVEEISEKGDCIDCNHCVAVCPTGIDIRHGTQLECVNCTACIDACDQIMEKVGKPQKLIRYATHNQIEKGGEFKLTTRTIAYSAILVILMSIFTGLMFTRGELDTSLLKARGNVYTLTEEGNVSNLFTFKMINKTSEEKTVYLKLRGENGSLQLVGQDQLLLLPNEMESGAVLVEFERENIQDDKFKIVIDVYEGERKIETIKTTFTGPLKI